MIDISQHLPFLNQRLDDIDHVTGEIYIMTNQKNGKQYVGQVRSHRLNCAYYKPFGYKRRLADHTSEAMCNTKKKQCGYLNNAIRKHGPENFTVELL